jgi:hypothetical protein
MAGEKPAAKESELQIKLVIKRKGFEISTEGTMNSITKEIDNIATFTDHVAEKIEVTEEGPKTESEPLPSAEEVSKTPTADIPVIKPTRSTIENIEALFNTPWGRTPRSVAEVIKALEINAVPDTANAVNIYLTRLIKRGFLRRIEKEGKWAYLKLPE